MFALRVLQRDAAARKTFLEELKKSDLPDATKAKFNRSVQRLEPMIQAGVDQLRADRAAADQAADQPPHQTNGQSQEAEPPGTVVTGEETKPPVVDQATQSTPFGGGDLRIDPGSPGETTALPFAPGLPPGEQPEKVDPGQQNRLGLDKGVEHTGGAPQGRDQTERTTAAPTESDDNFSQISGGMDALQRTLKELDELRTEPSWVIQSEPGRRLVVNDWQMIEPDVRMIDGQPWVYWQVGLDVLADGPEIQGRPLETGEKPQPRWVQLASEQDGTTRTSWNETPGGYSVEDTSTLIDWYRAGGQGSFYYDENGNAVSFDPAVVAAQAGTEEASDAAEQGDHDADQATQEPKVLAGIYQGEVQGGASGTIRFEVSANRQVTGSVRGSYNGSTFQGTFRGSIDPEGRLQTELGGSITTQFGSPPKLQTYNYTGGITGQMDGSSGTGSWRAGNKFGSPTGTWSARRQ